MTVPACPIGSADSSVPSDDPGALVRAASASNVGEVVAAIAEGVGGQSFYSCWDRFHWLTVFVVCYPAVFVTPLMLFPYQW